MGKTAETIEQRIQNSIGSGILDRAIRSVENLGKNLGYSKNDTHYCVENIFKYDADKDEQIILNAKGMKAADKQMIQKSLKLIDMDQSFIQGVGMVFGRGMIPLRITPSTYFYKMATFCDYFFSRDKLFRKKDGFIASVDLEGWSKDPSEDLKSIQGSNIKCLKVTECKFYECRPLLKGKDNDDSCLVKYLGVPKNQVIKSLSDQDIKNRVRSRLKS
jgi:hypothetical protein